jgi:hypothetical protein
VNAFATRGGWNPYDLALQYPQIAEHDWALGGDYANSVLARHPIEFLWRSITTFFTASDQYRAFSVQDAHGPVATPPLKLQVTLSAYVARTYRFFPLFALLWMALLFWHRAARLRIVERLDMGDAASMGKTPGMRKAASMVEAMGAVVLLALYELILTTVGGYSAYDYARIHVPFDPLLIVVIWGTVLLGLSLWREARQPLAWLWQHLWQFWGGALLLGVVGSVGLAMLSRGARAAVAPQSWLVVQTVLSHPPRALTMLALAALLSFLAYRAHRLPQKGVGSKLEEQEAKQAQQIQEPTR